VSLEAYEQYRGAYERMVANRRLSWRLREAARLMLAKLDAESDAPKPGEGDEG
jgi:hypothetical protein